MTRSRLVKIVSAPLVVGLGLLLAAATAHASSHREAPAIAGDPLADNTDVYAFINPNDDGKVVLVANYVPLLLPNSGPNFYRFGDGVRYEIRIDNDGDAEPDITYAFDFETTVRNDATFLYNTGPVDSLDDPDLNVRQTYGLRRIDHSNKKTEVLGQDLPAAPWNVGARSFPNYDVVADEAVQALPGGGRVFAGPRDEPFFVDLRVFDLLGVGGEPSTDGLNVMSLVLEVPITDVAKDGVRPAAGAEGPSSVLGVYARSLRRRYGVLGRGIRARREHGRFVQVSRLALPLVNEVLVPRRDKDFFNRVDPVDDASNFGAALLDPELPGLLASVLGLPCPPNPAEGREDILALLSPRGTVPADLLRLDIREGQTFADSGFPNGRRLEDDVTDILLTVACNGGVPVGDGVDANDRPFRPVFPFLAGPHPAEPAQPDADGDGVPADRDCDDDDATVRPGAAEICDGKDNDCNDIVDDAIDSDGDEWNACIDCDDEDSEVSPDQEEVCFNGKDDNCDDEIDEGCSFGRAVILGDDLDVYAAGFPLCLEEVVGGACVFFEEGDCVDDTDAAQPHLHGFVQLLGSSMLFGEFDSVCGFGHVIEGVPGCGADFVPPCGAPAAS